MLPYLLVFSYSKSFYFTRSTFTMLYKEITEKIIGCAMKVHSTLGNGFQEVIYQRALAIEMHHNGMHFEREKEMDIYYREEHIGTRRVDFFIQKVIMVELKALVQLEDVHLAQAMNYLESYKLPVGLLITLEERNCNSKEFIIMIYYQANPLILNIKVQTINAHPSKRLYWHISNHPNYHAMVPAFQYL
jgi:GxxExxY protein